MGAQSDSESLWLSVRIGTCDIQILNVDHPEVAARVHRDMDAGIRVYYDQRWAASERFCRYLLETPGRVAGKDILVLGAGLGLEALVIGRLCRQLYVNDLAPGALELCAWQLRQNGIEDAVCLPGPYERLRLPDVDLLVGCFLVYNRDTATAMGRLLGRRTPPVVLLNDNLPGFRRLVHQTARTVRSLLQDDDGPPCVVLTW